MNRNGYWLIKWIFYGFQSKQKSIICFIFYFKFNIDGYFLHFIEVIVLFQVLICECENTLDLDGVIMKNEISKDLQNSSYIREAELVYQRDLLVAEFMKIQDISFVQ